MSGSLLGVELNDLRSAPVGYMRILDMYPLDFGEFIKAVGVQAKTIALLKECFENRTVVDAFVYEKMLDIFYLYLIIGGMPEAVDVYLKTNDLNQVGRIHEDIIRLYKKDFSKYEKEHKLKLQEIYDAMAGQLNSKSKRFHLNTLGTGMNYDIQEAFVFSNANVEIVGKRIYMPVYMCMFLENIVLQDSVYKVDLRGI